MRQVLIPAASFDRVAEQVNSLDYNIDVLLWSPDAIRNIAGDIVESSEPEAAWLSIDLFMSGEIMAFVDQVIEFGSVKWVQGPLAGFDGAAFRKIIDAGVRLSNSDAPNIGVAEYVMSALLAHRHGIAERITNHRNKDWQQAPWPEIGGQRWIIVGFGSIGHEIAKRARPFGVEIVGVRRTATADAAADEMATMDELPTVLATADVVIIACPLTDETRGMVDATFLAAMAPHGVLVNVARGAIVNDGSLIAALDAGTIGGAILDVFDPEPLPVESPLWDHDKVTITSHLAGAGAGFVARNDHLFVEQVGLYLAGLPLRLEVS